MYPPPFPQTAFAYTTDAVTPGTTYTFCTRKDKYYYQAETASQTPIGTDSDYQATNAYFTALTVPDRLNVDRHAVGRADLVLAPIEPPDRRGVVIDDTPVPGEVGANRVRSPDDVIALFQER